MNRVRPTEARAAKFTVKTCTKQQHTADVLATRLRGYVCKQEPVQGTPLNGGTSESCSGRTSDFTRHSALRLQRFGCNRESLSTMTARPWLQHKDSQRHAPVQSGEANAIPRGRIDEPPSPPAMAQRNRSGECTQMRLLQQPRWLACAGQVVACPALAQQIATA